MDASDVKKVLYTAEEIEAIVAGMAERINADYRGKCLLVITVLKGACMFMTDLVRRLPDVDVELDFMVVSSYGSGTTSSGTVKIEHDLSCDIAGRDVLVVEDILDSGLTLSKLAEELGQRGAASVEIAVLMRKDLGHVPVVEPRYLGIVCPNEFVVGYGLDYNQKYRQLPYIGILDERVYA